MTLIGIGKNNVNKALGTFLAEYRQRTIEYLNKTFSLSKDDCEDIVQEASIVLHTNIVEGKLESLSSSLYTYFLGICNNKAHEQIRENQKIVKDYFGGERNDEGDYVNNEALEQKAARILSLIDEEQSTINEVSFNVQITVDNLPSPCKELLWAFYRDALSMKTLAGMFGYASENAVKVTKHRCQEKFRAKYEEMKKQLTK